MKRIYKMWITVLAAALLGLGLQSCTGMADIVYQTNYSVSVGTNAVGTNAVETKSELKKKSLIETTVVTNFEYYFRVSTVTNFEVNMERVGSETNSFDYTNSSALTNYLTNLIKQDEKIEEAEEEASEESEGKDTVSEKGGELNEDISVSFLGLTNQQQVGTNVVVNGLTSGEVSAVYAGVNGGEFRKMSGVKPWFGTFELGEKEYSTLLAYALDADNRSSATNQVTVYADSANQEADEDNSLRVVDGEESDQEAPSLNMNFSGSTVENGSLIRTGVVTISGSSSDEAGIEGIYVRIYEREIVTNGGVVTTNLVSVTDGAGNVITEYDQFVKVGVDENGNWTMPYVDLDTGDYVVQIYSQDQSYNTSETNEVGFSVDLTPTTGEIWVNQLGSQYTTNRTIQISNTFEYGSIKIAEEGTDLDSVAWLDCSETDVIEYLLSEGYGEKTITYVTRTTDLDGGVYQTNTITIELTGKVEEFDFSEEGLSGSDYVNGNGVPVFTNSQTLEIEGESGVVYKYTTDGSDPSTSQTAVVTAPGDGFEIVLGEGTTNQIKIVKEKTGWTDSEVVEQTYIITGQVDQPTFSGVVVGEYTNPEPGTYQTETNLAIPCPEGAVLRITTNGTDPLDENNATVITAGEGEDIIVTLPLNSTNEVKVAAVEEYFADSEVVSGTYVITGQLDRPEASEFVNVEEVDPNVIHTSAQEVEISVPEDYEYTVKYTVDGSDPESSSTAQELTAGETATVNVPLDSVKDIKIIAVAEDWTGSDVLELNYQVTGEMTELDLTANNPDPDTIYTTPQTVNIPVHAGGKVYYTTDGSDPKTSGTVQSSESSVAIEVGYDTEMDIKAYWTKENWDDSETAEVTYTVTGKVAIPTVDLSPNTYIEEQTVIASVDTEDAVIRYTLDGSVPTEDSAEITTEGLTIGVGQNVVLKLKAFKDNWDDSGVFSGQYIIKGTIGEGEVYIENGGQYTEDTTVTVNNTYNDTAWWKLADSEAGLADADWINDNSSTEFELFGNDEYGEKTVYVVLRVGDEGTTEKTNSAVIERVGTVETPTVEGIFNTGSVSPNEVYQTEQTVILTAPEGYTLKYTTDGSDPDAYGTAVESGESANVTISAHDQVSEDTETTIKVILEKPGWTDSEVVSATYNVTGTVPAPSEEAVLNTDTVNPGTIYTSAQTVEVRNPQGSGFTLKYTEDGSDPANGISIPEGGSAIVNVGTETTKTVKYVAVKDNWTSSEVTAVEYQVTGKVEKPEAEEIVNVESGLYTSAQTVTISAPEGYGLKYTTDGVDPSSGYGTLVAAGGSAVINIPEQSEIDLKVIATKSDWANSDVLTISYTVTGTTDEPGENIFNVNPGTYTESQNVSITAPSDYSVIYTTDGSEPTVGNGTVVNSGNTQWISVGLNTQKTVKYISYKPNWATSAVQTSVFKVTGTVVNPSLSLSGGEYAEAKNVTISAQTAGSAVVYTTDGSDPLTSATAVNGGSSVTVTMPLYQETVLKAAAVKTEWEDSSVVSAGYTISGTEPGGSIAINGGAQYTTSRNVTVVYNHQNSETIYYRIANSQNQLSGTIWQTLNNNSISWTLTDGIGSRTVYMQTTKDENVNGTSGTPVGKVTSLSDGIELTGVISGVQFSPQGGTYQTAQTISLNTSSDGAVIRYTTDGTTPSSTVGTVYSGEITIPLYTTKTVKAIAYKEGWTSSAVSSQTYNVTGPVAQPVFNLPGGNYDTSIDIEISTETSGAVIEYQTNNAGWTTYSEPIHVSISGEQKNINIEARAKKSDWTTSSVSTESYTVQGVIGTINGVVKQAQVSGNHTPLSGVLVRIYDVDGTFLEQSTTGSDGSYEFDVRTGDGYQVNYSKDGFVTVNYNDVTVEYNAFTYLETVLQVVDPGPTGPTTGAVSGQIKSATSGQGLSGVTLKFRQGMNTEAGQVVYQMDSGNNGNFDTGDVLEPGNYTVEVSESGYITTFFSVVVIAGETIGGQSIQIRPDMPEGQISFVLSWGERPYVLDSHLSGPQDDAYGNDRFHVYWGHPAFKQDGTYENYSGEGAQQNNDTDIAHLDRDSMSGYGPETITILEQEPGRYSYWVHHWDNYSGGSIASSGAKVKVYVGSTLVKTFYPPSGDNGRIWLVCDIFGSEIVPVQQYLDTHTAGPVRSDEPHEWLENYTEISEYMLDLPENREQP